MASTDGADKSATPAAGKPDEAARHVYGPRPITALLPPLTRPAFRKRSPAAAQLIADWAAIVGPALAAVSVPRKLFTGTLAIACSGPMALELQHLSTTLIERINTHLGRVAVTRLRFVQDGAPAQPAVPPAPPRQAVEAAARAVSGLPDGALRDALERLGRVVLARPPG